MSAYHRVTLTCGRSGFITMAARLRPQSAPAEVTARRLAAELEERERRIELLQQALLRAKAQVPGGAAAHPQRPSSSGGSSEDAMADDMSEQQLLQQVRSAPVISFVTHNPSFTHKGPVREPRTLHREPSQLIQPPAPAYRRAPDPRIMSLLVGPPPVHRPAPVANGKSARSKTM